MTEPAVMETQQSMWARLCRVLWDHPTVAPLQTRRNRRLLAVVFVSVMVAMPVVGWLTDQMWAVLVMLIPFGAGAVLLAVANRGLLDRPMSKLDERERQLRQTIFGDSFAVGATAGLLAGMIMMVALDQSDPLMMGLLLPAISGLYLLPSIVLAWRTPDAVDDE